MTNTTMNVQQVKLARRAAYDGASVDEIASQMNLNYGPVYCAITGRTWSSITNPKPVPGEIIRQNGLSERVCINCGYENYKGGTTTRCGACSAYWYRHDCERPQEIRHPSYIVISKKDLRDLYERYCEGASTQVLAATLPFSEETLRRRFHQNGLPLRKNTAAKEALTAEIVRHARIMVHIEGACIFEVAQMYGINYQTMYTAVNGHTWRGAGGPIPEQDAEKQPCIHCEMLTSHQSSVCRFCRNGG